MAAASSFSDSDNVKGSGQLCMVILANGEESQRSRALGDPEPWEKGVEFPRIHTHTHNAECITSSFCLFIYFSYARQRERDLPFIGSPLPQCSQQLGLHQAEVRSSELHTSPERQGPSSLKPSSAASQSIREQKEQVGPTASIPSAVCSGGSVLGCGRQCLPCRTGMRGLEKDYSLATHCNLLLSSTSMKWGKDIKNSGLSEHLHIISDLHAVQHGPWVNYYFILCRIK